MQFSKNFFLFVIFVRDKVTHLLHNLSTNSWHERIILLLNTLETNFNVSNTLSMRNNRTTAHIRRRFENFRLRAIFFGKRLWKPWHGTKPHHVKSKLKRDKQRILEIELWKHFANEFWKTTLNFEFKKISGNKLRVLHFKKL